MKKLQLLLVLLAVFTLSACKKDNTDEPSKLDKVKEELVLEDTLSTMILPTSIDGVSISWISTDQSAITSGFAIIQKEEAYETTLVAILSYEGEDTIKEFDVTIAKIDTSTADLAKINEFLSTYQFRSYDLTSDIELPTLRSGISIVWSTNSDCMDNYGDIVRPEENEADCIVTATGIFSYNEAQATKDYVFTIKAIDGTQTVTYSGYYEGADGLEGEQLKSFLHDLIDNHTVVSYGDLRQALQDSDEDPDNPNNIILIYSGKSIPSTWDGGSSWNREHVWPRSHGDLDDGGNPAYSDMHHLRPCHPTVNSTRGNLYFDEGGTLVPNTTDSYKDSNSFEPRDEVKGDIARMILYMAVRYEGDDGHPDLEVVNTVTSGPDMGKLDILLQWHLEDLPDEFEKNRNDVIYGYQNNRNPFVDHPEFVELIWGSN